MNTRSDIKVGFACNNRCAFCAQGENRRTTKQLDTKTLVEHMHSAFRPGRGLVLTGGEPTIRKDLVNLVRAARKIGYRAIQVQTNGRMLHYAELVDKLRAAGVTEVSPALHGPDADVHDELTGAPGSFDQTCAGITNALAAGLEVITNTVVTKPNLPHLADTLAVLHRLGVRQAQLALVHPVGTAAERFDEVVPRITDAAAAIADGVRRGRTLGMRVVVEAMPLCLMRGIEDAVVEQTIPETTVVDADGEHMAFSDWRRTEGKAKGPPCEGCAAATRCEGPWREYPAHFGWAEYPPLG